MCGFAGLLSLNNDIEHEHLSKMQQAIIHRGPDSNGIWISNDNHVGFCHNRLSIIDISNAGAQPMGSINNRFIISFNGEIYNHLELRSELTKEYNNLQFKGGSDTETLLTCFEMWGIEKTVKQLVGMFAFALWDFLENTLVLGRDRLGEKPLYYGWQGDNFYFGSELKSFRSHPRFNPEINHTAISMYFRYSYIPAPHSIYRDIKKLTPGTILKIKSKSEEEQIEFWSLINIVENGKKNPYKGTDDEIIQELDLRLNRTISDQQISDVPIGAFLSGGIDSTLVSSIMQHQSNTKINTFTIGFKEGKYNEANYAKDIAKFLNTNHHELYLGTEDIIAAIPQMTDIYDEPFADSSQLPTYFVSKLAKEHVTVSLSGDAGDEIFGGYNRYVQSSRFNKYPQFVKSGLGMVLNQLSPKQVDAVYDFLKPILPNSLMSSNAGNHYAKIVNLLNQKNNWEIYQSLVSICKSPESFFKGSTFEQSINNYTKPLFDSGRKIEEEMMMADTLTYLPDDILCKVDRASMSVSLESRVPFLDHRLIEFAYQLPINMKIRDGRGKWILRKLLDKYVPNELIERPKMGFGLPLDIWLRGPLKLYAESMLCMDSMKNDIFLDGPTISRIWEEHQSGKKNHQHLLWNIIMFQSWRKKWL